MSLSIADAVRQATIRLKKAGIIGASQDARILLADIFAGDREIQFREPERLLTKAQSDAFENFIHRRESREPVSHILGRREFWSRNFYVTSDVLDPRPDSETLIEAALSIVDETVVSKVLDLGTGSGCLILTLLAEIPQAQGLAVDQSSAALNIAAKNAAHLGLSGRISFKQSNWFSSVTGTYDLIISNPPYIETKVTETLEPEVSIYEPRAALDGGADGLVCYREIIHDIGQYLTPEGAVVFEVGKGQASDVAALLADQNFTDIRIHNDLASVERCVSARCKK
ncbi:peptide chain release factor N(5)-glutamine methyltransferase [Sneathiella sp.]|jgi:release factor glutamine methyltransferase|uniref:peptide chain release factor N(5)-glutamine methyltransferase n=1 Tax=Sneathiella sp. TaxID=1964365 RepID=UPI0039E4B45C